MSFVVVSSAKRRISDYVYFELLNFQKLETS